MIQRLILCAFLLVIGCANEVDNSENLLLVPKAASPCDKCLSVGKWYKFTELTLNKLAGGSDGLVGLLSDTWGADIVKQELAIYMWVQKIEGGNVTFELVNGARMPGGGLCVLTETAVSLVQPLEETGLGESEPTIVRVFAGSVAHPKNCNPEAHHSIPVSNVIASGACSETCDNKDEDFIAGTFVGSLTQAQLNKTCTCVVLGEGLSDEKCGVFDPEYVDTSNDGACDGCGEKYSALKLLVPTFNGGNELDFTSCEEAAGEPSACLEASFRAYRIDEAPPNCE